MEIIRMLVDDHRSSYDILHPEPVSHHRKAGSAIPPSKQGRQISPMHGVQIPSRVIMAAGVREALPPAIPLLVDMKSEKTGFRTRQTFYFCLHNGSAAPWPECHAASHILGRVITPDAGYGCRRRFSLHDVITSGPAYAFPGKEVQLCNFFLRQ